MHGGVLAGWVQVTDVWGREQLCKVTHVGETTALHGYGGVLARWERPQMLGVTDVGGVAHRCF